MRKVILGDDLITMTEHGSIQMKPLFETMDRNMLSKVTLEQARGYILEFGKESANENAPEQD